MQECYYQLPSDQFNALQVALPNGVDCGCPRCMKVRFAITVKQNVRVIGPTQDKEFSEWLNQLMHSPSKTE